MQVRKIAAILMDGEQYSVVFPTSYRKDKVVHETLEQARFYAKKVLSDIATCAEQCAYKCKDISKELDMKSARKVSIQSRLHANSLSMKHLFLRCN